MLVLTRVGQLGRSRPHIRPDLLQPAGFDETPIATPANLMVFEPDGYRFGDYWKLGLPLALLFIIIATFYVPLIWHF